MTYYNLSNLSTNFDPTVLLIEINSKANGMIAIFILVAVFLLIFISLKNYESKRAFAAASFITCIISVLMNIIGFIQIYFTVILIIMTAGSMIMMNVEDG